MSKLDLEKEEEPKIKLPTSAGSSKKQENSRKIYTSALLIAPKLWQCRSQHAVENSREYQTTLPTSWEICIQAKKQQLELDMNNTLVPNQERSVSMLFIGLCLFNFYAQYIMWNAELDEAQAGIKTARRNINNLRYADYTILMPESEEELKNLLMKVK